MLRPRLGWYRMPYLRSCGYRPFSDKAALNRLWSGGRAHIPQPL